MALLILFLSISVAISFLCSVLESVLLSTPLSFITMKVNEGSKSATTFLKLKQNPERPLSAILTLNTIANTVGAAGVGRQASIVFGNVWFGLVSAAVTILILIFGEIIPKSIGTAYWKRLLPLGKVIQFLVWMLYPVVVTLQLIAKLFSPKSEDPTVSREEVSAIANIGEEEGVIDQSENKVIQNIIKLDDVKAYDVMTPRAVVAFAPETMTLREFYKDDNFSHFSRVPIYSDSPDNICGYVMRNDILELLADDNFSSPLSVVKRDIEMFNEDAAVSDIWESLLKTKDQIALIIDEYGSFQGVLTLEDIIETILGMEIVDESDEYSDMQQYARERWKKRQNRFKQISIPE